jgi:SAM-dependent methyltransferase
VEQNQNKKKLLSCPLCGSKKITQFLTTNDYFFTQEEFNLDECSNCSLVFTNPIPAPNSLSKYYETDKYLSHNSRKGSVLDIIYRTARALNIRFKYKLVSKYKKASDVLEIGSGTGDLLNYFVKKGWRATGIEPSVSARNFSVEKFGLSVFDEDKIEQLEKQSFALIMMWHVLEHVTDLNKRILQIKNLLKKNGVIVIAVPNINSPDFKFYKQYWAGLDVPRHLYHFSKESISYLFKSHGIHLEAVYPMKLDAYYVSLLSEKYQGRRLKYLNALRSGYKSNMLAKRQKNNYSSMIFVARKN